MFVLPEKAADHSISVAVVQPNINSYTEKWSTPERAQIQKVDRLLRESGANDVDLIVLPETFLPKARQEDGLGKSVNDAVLQDALRFYGKAAIFGATTYDFQEEQTYYNRPMGDRFYTLYNSALFQSSGPNPLEVYHKGKLVVGGESMPFVKYLQPLLGDWALELGGTSGTLGTSEQRKVFEDEALGLTLAPIICWENEFSGYATEYSRKGANLLAVITNDGWWGDTDGHVQHMRFSALRAVEHRKYVVRSANTGISTIIDTKGRPKEQLFWEQEGVLLDQVPLLEGKTLYVRTGNWLGPLMSIIFSMSMLVVLISRFFRIRP
jgi:apolipoprotein N-acyltransferase